MKARVKATGKIVKVFDTGNGLFEASDGETYFSQGLHFIDDEPDYWEKLKHQYAGMAMQGILANCNHQLWEKEANRAMEVRVSEVKRKVADINSLVSSYYIMAESLDMILREMERQFKSLDKGLKHRVKQRHSEMMRLMQLLKTTQEKFVQDYECFNGEWQKYDDLRSDAAYIARIMLYISDRTFGDDSGKVDREIEAYLMRKKSNGMVSEELINNFKIK